MRRGFTLAEVMVAILFVSIAMFGYFALHLRIIHSASTLEQRQAMRRHLERAAYSVRYGNRPPQVGVFPIQPLQPGTTAAENIYAEDPNQAYDGNVTVTLQTSPPGTYRVEYSIFWENKHGRQNYVIDTFVRDKDAGW